MKINKKCGLIEELQVMIYTCPECGGPMEENSGCPLCSHCGFSPCG